VIRFKSGFCAFGIVASLAGPVFAQDCSVADQAALETLRQVMHPEHPSAFAARAVVQTAVGIQQVLVSRGEADASRAGVPVPLHSAACRDPSHRLLFETGSQCGVAQWYKFETISQQLSGRQATVVTALPKDVYRHGFQLVVDDATCIVLRSALFFLTSRCPGGLCDEIGLPTWQSSTPFVLSGAPPSALENLRETLSHAWPYQ
jgi:hypothetical protein